MKRPWVLPSDVIAYTESEKVKKRDVEKLKTDIARAESYVIFKTHNDFTAEGYADSIPDDVKSAVIMLAESYALKAINQATGGTVQSETLDDYSYTFADADTDLIDKLGLGPMLDPYVLAKASGKINFKLRRL